MNLFCPECHAKYDNASLRTCPQDGTRLYRVDTSDPLIGATIDGRFRADYILGAGGMGTVYGGVQLSVNRDVAIKVLRTELSNREVALERFFREAKTISKLSHPNIVKLIDFGQDHERDLLYLVMELVRGDSLGDVLARGRVRAALALDIIYQVCGALTEPHEDGVVHRDLKPDNLLLTPMLDGTMQVKVLDFGIARFMESNTQLTGTGMICGTPAYMAPEQAQNETLDARTDLYALGVILYEALSGWPPFSGTSSLQIMLKHISEEPTRLRDLLPPAALPPELEELVYWLLSKDRDKRPRDAMQVRDRIEELRRDLDLAPVRVARKEARAAIDEFVLPKLPKASADASGPTQVLRRETGLKVVAVVNDTAADPEVAVTGPLTPDQKALVKSDQKVQTKQGGQQAWTPQGQDAIRSIKDTFDGVDAHARTETSTPEPREVRARVNPTPLPPMVARSEEFENTDDIEQPRAVGSGLSTRWLVIVAAAVIAAIGVTAYLLAEHVKTLTTHVGPSEPPPLVVSPEVVEPVEAGPPSMDARQLLDFVAARSTAENHVRRGVITSASAATVKPGTPAKPNVTKTHARQRAEPREVGGEGSELTARGNGNPPEPSKTHAPLTTDAMIENLGLRQE